MNLFEKREQRASLFTAFLNVKGRVLFDCIIVKPKLAGQHEEPEYWLDVHEDDADNLVRHLKRYALRDRELDIQDISHAIGSHALQAPNSFTEMYDEKNEIQPGDFFPDLQDTVELHDSEEWPGEKETDVAVFVDPRCPQLGVRFLCAHGSFDLEDGDELDEIKRMNDVKEYTLYR